MAPKAWRAGALFALIVTSMVTASCWSSNQLKAPDLQEQIAIVEGETQRQRQIDQIMERDLARLDDLIRSILGEEESAYAPPFPVQTFRVAAMSCLHEVVLDAPLQDEIIDEGEELEPLPPTPIELAAQRFGVTCTTEPLVALDARLLSIDASASKEAARALAMRQMNRIETLRQLRDQLTRRQQRIDDVLAQARQTLAEQRALWRRTATNVDSRRFDYTASELERARDRLNAQRTRQDELEIAIDTLEEHATKWPERLRSHLDALTYELAWIGLPRTTQTN